MAVLDLFFFTALPYVAVAIFSYGTIKRYRTSKFSYSSLSSQFMEGRRLFWGSVPFHWGLLIVFTGHLIAFLFPKTLLLFNQIPLRLVILEISGFAAAIATYIGLSQLIVRRMTHARIRVVTSPMDWLIIFLLYIQIITGLLVALFYRWGSSWFAAVLTPYLYSIFRLQPDIAAVSALPWLIKTHIIGAFLILALLPFTRLVHLLVYPLHYLWRPYQRVLWYRDRQRRRKPTEPWLPHKPRNN